MTLMTGKEYLESIQDGRLIHLDGELVGNAVADPRCRGAAMAIAQLYDMQHDASKRDVLTYTDTETGSVHPRAFKIPRTLQDLQLRHQAFRMNMEPSFGMMGRAPDFLNAWLAALAAGAEVFDKSRHSRNFADNVRNYYRYVRDNNLTLTHVLVNPQPDRSKPVWEQAPGQDIALKITRETGEGFYVSGSRMVGTLALYAHEVLVMPSSVKPNSPAADVYCFGFAAPLATKGLHLISRSSLTPRTGASERDYPLSSRFEENDAVLVFEDVFVPWERTFFYRDAELASNYGRSTFCGAHAVHQVLVRSLVKTEFLAGLAQEVSAAVNGDAIPEVQQQLCEIYMMIESLSAVLYKAEHEYVKTPFDSVAPNQQVLAAGQIDFYEKFTRMIEILRSLTAGAMVAAPSIAELQGPASELIQRHCVAANRDAERWVQLLRLVIDTAMSGFGSRQQIYEKYYQGPPHMVRAMYARNYPRRAELSRRINDALDVLLAA
jgi:4-hydroxyphenylacetate 3-monooxygenase